MSESVLLAKGKTKEIYRVTLMGSAAMVKNLPIVTWDDQFQKEMLGKDIWATTTTCNVFRAFVDAGIPVAFEEQISDTEFLAPYCRMIPLEVVVRFGNEPGSSYSKRNTDVPLGPFKEPQIEFFLKTSGRTFNGTALTTDDPYIHSYDEEGVWICHPKQRIETNTKFVFIRYTEEFGPEPLKAFTEMSDIALRSGIALRDMWVRLGWTLGDFKEEFGFAPWGEVLLADVLDNDSWRIQDPDGIERSKQIIRNGMSPEDAKSSYAMVADASRRLKYEL